MIVDKGMKNLVMTFCWMRRSDDDDLGCYSRIMMMLLRRRYCSPWMLGGLVDELVAMPLSVKKSNSYNFFMFLEIHYVNKCLHRFIHRLTAARRPIERAWTNDLMTIFEVYHLNYILISTKDQRCLTSSWKNVFLFIPKDKGRHLEYRAGHRAVWPLHI